MNKDIEKWADSRNTDIEIATAIHGLTILPERTPEEVWEEPTDVEYEEVLRVAFLKTAADILYWGDHTIKRCEL